MNIFGVAIVLGTFHSVDDFFKKIRKLPSSFVETFLEVLGYTSHRIRRV